MTKASEMRGELSLVVDRVGRHLDESDKFGKDIASDLEVFRERQQSALERYANRMQQAYDAYATEIEAISKGMTISTNAKLIQTGIVEPPDSVKSIAAKCTPDLSRLEMRKK